jgi:hypothetical protein
MGSFSTRGDSLSHLIVVGCHHKCGTNWMSSIFRELAGRMCVPFLEGDQPRPLDAAGVFFQDKSRFDFRGLPEGFRGVHMIRDPRDVVISACFYHQTSGEAWLHIKRRRFGGLTYQEKLNSYPSIDDRLFFEMEHSSLITIREIWGWNYANPDFLELRYEDLVVDTELKLFERLFEFLRLPRGMSGQALDIARRNSLFSGGVSDTAHIRSGQPRQWPGFFKAQHSERFLQLFGKCLIDLGYEADHQWAGADVTDPGHAEALQHDVFTVLYHPDDPESNMSRADYAVDDEAQEIVRRLQKQITNRDREIAFLRTQLRR